MMPVVSTSFRRPRACTKLVPDSGQPVPPCTASHTASGTCSTGLVSARIGVHLHPKNLIDTVFTADLGDLRTGSILGSSPHAAPRSRPRPPQTDDRPRRGTWTGCRGLAPAVRRDQRNGTRRRSLRGCLLGRSARRARDLACRRGRERCPSLNTKLGHERFEDTHQCVEAGLQLKEDTLLKLEPLGQRTQRFKADSPLLAFLASL